MDQDLLEFLTDRKVAIEAGLRSRMPASSVAGGERLNEALAYALFPGGQRWRPVFTLLGAALIEPAGASINEDALSVACAVEFLHTSSLIFDDLPAMDDADLRRGKVALHLDLRLQRSWSSHRSRDGPLRFLRMAPRVLRSMNG